MPTNKNALTRIVLLDRLLSDRYHSYSIRDITDILNEELPQYGQEEGISKRCVEKDINYLEFNFPELIDFERYYVDAYSSATDRPYRKKCIRYADPTFSIFKGKLSEEEKGLLSAALTTIGSFEGLDSFGWLEDFRRRLGLVEQVPVIHMSKNLLENRTLIAEIFSAIRAKTVIRIAYHKFNDEETKEFILSPHLLKEFNRRWYVIGTLEDNESIRTFALDRIKQVDLMQGYPYHDTSENIAERFEEIIGITYFENAPLHEIIFFVSDSTAPYIRTKPLHGSQKEIKGEKEQALRLRYSLPLNGSIFSIECKENYELIRELTSFSDLRVLSPEAIITSIKLKINELYKNYF